MMQLGALHINTDRPDVIADFYGKVLQSDPPFSTEDLTEYIINDFRLEIMRHSEISGRNKDGARLMFNLMVDDVPAEFDRITDLGAEVIAEPYEFDTDDAHLTIATLADPDGNYFQLVSVETV